MHVIDNIARLVNDVNSGFFLYVDDDTSEHPTPPKATHIIDKIAETFIGFLIFKESAESSIDKIKVIEIPHIIPNITEKIKLLLLAVLPLIIFSFFIIKCPLFSILFIC